MSAVARRIRATPFRTTGGAWDVIVDLVCAHDESLRTTFDKIANVGSMLIAEEHTKSDPVIVSGCGPQARFYTTHGQAAIDGADANESGLQLQTSKDWAIALPATGVDFDLATNAVAGIERVSVYDPATTRTTNSAAVDAPATIGTRVAKRITVDLSALE
jgi:hypothetical protein